MNKLSILFVVTVLCSAVFVQCGNDDDDSSSDSDTDTDSDTDSDSDSDTDSDTDTDTDDPIESFRQWYLVGNDLTSGHDQLELAISGLGQSAESVDIWIDGAGCGEVELNNGACVIDPDISGLDVGEHELQLFVDGGAEPFVELTFYRSHPIYVLMTNDWDDSDNSDQALVLQEELHAKHPAMKMTHFVGPYTFTDPAMDQDRIDLLVEWVLGMRDTYDDEIGLHVHPYCNFVETTSVTCRHEPSFSSAFPDETGYTVNLNSYTEEESIEIFAKGVEIFEDNGLGTPTSFRAGGWTAQAHTLAALAANGFVADTSANNWARIEEWENVEGASIYQWSEENWSSINDTSQPYYPSEADAQYPGKPQIDLLELPDNGCLVDYVSAAEMIYIFDANFTGEALTEPKAYVFGYHPTNFILTYQNRLDETMTYIEQFMASSGDGPVVYETLSNMVLVWD